VILMATKQAKRALTYASKRKRRQPKMFEIDWLKRVIMRLIDHYSKLDRDLDIFHRALRNRSLLTDKEYRRAAAERELEVRRQINKSKRSNANGLEELLRNFEGTKQ